MSMTDPIADMLTRIRNAQKARKEFDGDDLASKIEEIADWLKKDFDAFVIGLANQTGENVIGNNLFMWAIRGGEQVIEEGKQTWRLPQDRNLLGDTSTGSTIGIDDTRWRNYVVKFEARVELGNVYIGLRMVNSFGGEPPHARIPMKGADKKWKQFALVAWGMKFYEVDLGTNEVRPLSPKMVGEPQAAGGIGFIIDGAGTLKVRNMSKVDIKAGE